MDDDEFRRLLDLFPIVRSRHYHGESEQSRESTSKSPQHEALKGWQDAWDEDKSEVEKQGIGEHCEFWGKIKLVAERKVGATEAERFCKAFQRIHKRLVCEGLSLDAAQKFLNLS
ncbi:uncharacterized protein LOC103928992 isoform X1 [Pyrus x bretschneideri]|uniref:uncharacterized protein LOC103928992 isoform X1 n=1 Tax=Pyrus x bretschneideri TaxID=225117 RepID=UPI00202F343C|nr:uncharacterized protein LOC103928992 isoform X1 [Pyrus x bretschneideri]